MRPIAPVVVLVLVYAAALVHWRGVPAAPYGAVPTERVAAGLAGLAALALALGPPLDGWATGDLAAHMVQHVLLLSVVPPLLLLGRVPAVVAAALPLGRRMSRDRPAGSGLARPMPAVALTALAIAAQTVAVGLWHVPRCYDAAVGNDAIHAAEHLTFLGAGCFFWWTLMRLNAQLGSPAALVALFAASLPATLLGALMTLSTTPWYPRYTTGTVADAAARQQLAGVVMWAVGGMVTVVGAVALFGAWLATMDRATRARLDWEPTP